MNNGSKRIINDLQLIGPSFDVRQTYTSDFGVNVKTFAVIGKVKIHNIVFLLDVNPYMLAKSMF